MSRSISLQALVLGLAAAEPQEESLAVGGQAVIEGIMMRNGAHLALAVRRPDGTVTSRRLPWTTLFQAPFLRKPWLRGFPVLLETMVNGIKTLNLSAELAAESEGEPLKPWQIALTLATAVGLALLLFLVIPHLLTLALSSLSIAGGVEGVSFHIWDGCIKFAMFIGYIAAISRLPDIRRVFEYHGAEHKAIAAYEQGESVLTPASVRKYSRLHPRCGTTFLLFVLSVSIFLHAVLVPAFLLAWTPAHPVAKHLTVIIFKLLLIVPISAVAYEVTRRAARMNDSLPGAVLRAPGLMLQRMTTREPDDSQLEVGLVALAEALAPEKADAFPFPRSSRLEQV